MVGLNGSAATRRRRRRGGLGVVLGCEIVELGRIWDFLRWCEREVGEFRVCFGLGVKMLEFTILIMEKERRRLERLPVPIKAFLRCKPQPLKLSVRECPVFPQAF